jgi:hypothetical protein
MHKGRIGCLCLHAAFRSYNARPSLAVCIANVDPSPISKTISAAHTANCNHTGRLVGSIKVFVFTKPCSNWRYSR